MSEITDARIDEIVRDHEYFKKEGLYVSPAQEERFNTALEIRRLRKQEEDARGLMEGLEWSVLDLHGKVMTCPSCHRFESKGHAPDCALAAWLKGE